MFKKITKRRRALSGLRKAETKSLMQLPGIQEGNPVEWNVEGVACWVSTVVMLPQYTNLFRKHAINGEALMQLSEEYIKRMGVCVIGYRKHIMREKKNCLVKRLSLCLIT